MQFLEKDLSSKIINTIIHNSLFKFVKDNLQIDYTTLDSFALDHKVFPLMRILICGIFAKEKEAVLKRIA